MTLVEFVPPTPHPLWELCPQMGITDVIVKVNPDLTGLPDPWRYETLSRIAYRLKDAGLNVVGLEGDPFDMSPIKEYGEREEALEHYSELLESMGKLGIKLLCYNFMVGRGWSRTGVREGRGGAKATYFSLKELTPKESDGSANASPIQNVGALAKTSDKSELKISHDQVWANYEYFIKAVMPTAEKCGVRMALHPDDPCLPSLGGYARIFGSVEAYDRAYALCPSPSNAVTFCQANFKLMGVDLDAAARHFGKRIAFIHVRDVDGTKEDFTELFHDQGTTDQFALMRTYRELGLDVPLRGDHVPEMAYDRELTPEGTPGYFTLGRLFANGYLKALLQGTSLQSRSSH
ncbi:MAG: mannonate dehydratase [Kiritimatiellae bacterium]|nr:mannonate dehydratase [Kiritimatiellia bacterium]